MRTRSYRLGRFEVTVEPSHTHSLRPSFMSGTEYEGDTRIEWLSVDLLGVSLIVLRERPLYRGSLAARL